MRSATSKTSSEVVADHHHRQPAPLELVDEVEHLPRLRHAQRGRRLVEQHELRARPAATRAIATIWRCPPESDATGVVTLGMRAESERMSSPDSFSIPMSSIVQSHRSGPGLYSSWPRNRFPGHVEVVGEREVLVDGRDPEVRQRPAGS